MTKQKIKTMEEDMVSKEITKYINIRHCARLLQRVYEPATALRLESKVAKARSLPLLYEMPKRKV